jgi:hypothetical protein
MTKKPRLKLLSGWGPKLWYVFELREDGTLGYCIGYFTKGKFWSLR